MALRPHWWNPRHCSPLKEAPNCRKTSIYTYIYIFFLKFYSPMILFPVLFLALVLVRPKRFQTNGSWWQLQPLPSPWMTRIWRPLVSSFQCLENPNQIQPLDLAGGVCVATSFEDPTGTGGSPGNKKGRDVFSDFKWFPCELTIGHQNHLETFYW